MNEKTRKRVMDYFCGFNGNPIEQCARLAYGDLRRTLRGIGDLPDKESYVSSICKIISDRIDSNEPIYDFNKWHDGVCNEIITASENFPQFKDKVTMSSYNKHFHYGQAQKWLNVAFKNMVIFELHDKYPKLERTKKHLHIPVDQYIINGVAKEFGEKRPKNAPYAWSRWNREQYIGYQKALKNRIPSDKPPIEWEIENWPRFKKELSL
ncbi:MAG: hypothetical protein FWE59_00015 [Oscillospiraceae bacterium]|nr:hypothetical protein [Oscillospiraceae bacterium]